jgi:hypothetical protein
MLRVFLFSEDFAHEAFITALLERVVRSAGSDVVITPYSVRGGKGRVIAELKEYLRDLRRGAAACPDILVVATDSNCTSFQRAKARVMAAVDEFPGLNEFTICAVPDPHIERWLLLDSAAFKSVFGRGCRPPDSKCDRDRYKSKLSDAIRTATGSTPYLGGSEFSAELVTAMDLRSVQNRDKSIRDFLVALRSILKRHLRGQA